jgi:hypothetical protein
MRRLIIIASLFATSAHAECLQWGRMLNTGERVCIMDDAVNRNPIIPEVPQHVIPGPGEGTISNYTPKCPDGYQLVYIGRPACARDIIDPY